MRVLHMTKKQPFWALVGHYQTSVMPCCPSTGKQGSNATDGINQQVGCQPARADNSDRNTTYLYPLTNGPPQVPSQPARCFHRASFCRALHDTLLYPGSYRRSGRALCSFDIHLPDFDACIYPFRPSCYNPPRRALNRGNVVLFAFTTYTLLEEVEVFT